LGLAGLLLCRAPMLIPKLLLAAALASPPMPPPRPAAQPRSDEAEARVEAARLLGMALAGEPRIEAVQRAAEARAAPGRDEAEGWRRRARLAALAPRLVAEYRHDERSYRVLGLASGSEVDYVRSTPGDTVSVRLDFDLSSLVFGRHELEAAAAAQRAEARRHAAAERATRLYHERLRLRVALAASPPATARARAELEIELEAVTAQLDALTGLYGEGAP
jgi:hypothetical protein